MQTRNLKQALNHELVLKKVHILIELNQKAWLKPYIDINAELRKNAYPRALIDGRRWKIFQILIAGRGGPKL